MDISYDYTREELENFLSSSVRKIASKYGLDENKNKEVLIDDILQHQDNLLDDELILTVRQLYSAPIIRESQLDNIKELIENGADPNKGDIISLVLNKNDTDLLDILLDTNFEININNKLLRVLDKVNEDIKNYFYRKIMLKKANYSPEYTERVIDWLHDHQNAKTCQRIINTKKDEKRVVKALIFDKSMRYFVVVKAMNRQFVPTIYDLPGGKIKQGEDELVGLYREICEEIGINVVPNKIYKNKGRYLVILDKDAEDVELIPGPDVYNAFWQDANMPNKEVLQDIMTLYPMFKKYISS